ncbi:MAG TPA: 2-C-methyl-D-erythritol 2,4-cyclodiphosphate synthase [Candidatus Baltobacteraceae bacterium]|jgi:2-C-methyl-D-erythritol 2,4-cyclodiphosphate synthase|nr:2-C-methyl-D-erythritol 2,4-cyclodiphosphate synthase [Candidatus Baltobacteraceae bacterium]
MRVGHGFDAHRLVEGRPFILGGVRIPFERGPLGHSDGDVLAHALADAILGACALGDLGRHFSDANPRWKDADSLELLRSCAALAEKSGYVVGNADTTVVVQSPKLAPHVEAMRVHLADALHVNVSCVGVKAKTSEGMGYTGDGSGIVAYAVVMMMRREDTPE